MCMCVYTKSGHVRGAPHKDTYIWHRLADMLVGQHSDSKLA